MRKTALVLALVLLLVAFAIPAAAAESRMSSVYPGLSISGTTANCSVTISGEKTSDVITATIRLWRGNTCIVTWNATGSGYLIWSNAYTITKGYKYALTVDAVIDGTTFPRATVYANA